ncbi:unnamed protein product (macronuclear) [Paramecium tetraurelia]|uniref:Uncharacterized protein n=1 Tax=Paramecium tetraurelia TaxID=5888 RepID=A0CAI8_PARTE|nr:uncharacterized protein GSPATT00036585001 [Paramecium tetraurelia]CAK67805.1 unnamed protein product [Paramecium tetraurelia]|eukprot:XP_001435202.1 hypothetical protein (macronuclear) [Paramecium tetraurelia strain d4-2]
MRTIRILNDKVTYVQKQNLYVYMNFNQIIRSRSKSPVRQIPRTCHVSYFKVKEQRRSHLKKEYFSKLEAAFHKISQQLLQYSFKQIRQKLQIDNEKTKIIQERTNQKILMKTFSKWSRQYKSNKLSQSLISSPTFSNNFKSSKYSVSEFKISSTAKKQPTLTTKKVWNALVKIYRNNQRLIFTLYKIFQIQKVKKKSILYKWYKRTYKRLLLNQKLYKLVSILNKQIAKYLKAI